MVLLFARNTSDRGSKKSGESKLKRHFSCRVNKLEQKSFTTDDSNKEIVDEDKEKSKLKTFLPFLSKDSSLEMATPTRHQMACAHRSLPRYYSNNYGKQNGVSGCVGGGNGNSLVYSASSANSGQPLLACDDTYLSTGTRKTDAGDSSLMESYELSTDFQQKHVEMLERKYGGRIRARRAAIVIQRAYRKYRLEKKFENLRSSAVDGRRRSGGRSRMVLNRFHTSASSSAVLNHNSGGNVQQRVAVAPQQQYHRQHYQYTSSKKITKTDGRIVVMDERHQGLASSELISQESLADGQQRARVIMGNQQQASLSPSRDNGVLRETAGGPRLKLHRYNIGGHNHASAPLTAQLQHMQDEETPRGSVLHPHNSSAIHVKVTEVDPMSSVPEQEEKRQNGNKYRPPAVNILRNRSVSMERGVVLGGSGLSLATEKSREEGGRLRQHADIVSPHFESQSARRREQLGELKVPYASYVRLGPPSSAVTQREEKPSSGALAATRLTARTASPSQQFVSPKSCALHHYSSSTPRSEVLNSSCSPDGGGPECGKSKYHQGAAILSPTSSLSPTANLDVSPNVTVRTSPSPTTTPTHILRQNCATGSRRHDSDHSTPVWLPMALAPENGHILPRGVANKEMVNEAPQPALSRSLPESQWLRHWGRRSLISVPHRQSELERKRQYRIALNFFNKKPERGVQFLVDFGFVEGSPAAVAKLLISRKGLSKQMIGEYLGNLMNSFNMAVLECFANEVDMTGMDLDVALRRFQSLFRLPGEAQKIERIMEVFARRYCECNRDVMKQFRQADTIFLLAFAIIMLNTDLHSPNIKAEKRMKLEDFMKNLRGIDGGGDVNAKFLTGIYHRVKEQEFKPGSDHVTQVLKVDRSIVGKKPTLALPHRRLVCYCRLYEVMDPQKKQAANVHQREIFLFNDLILITKILSRKKNSVTTYTFRSCHTLVGMQVQPFRNQHYANGLRINHTLENKTFYFNARSEEDRTKFMEDLKESICESDEMEALRIELELEKQNKFCGPSNVATTSHRSHSLGRGEQRDSGLPELDEPNGAVAVVSKNPPAAQASAGAANKTNGANGAASSRARELRPRCASLTSLDSGMSSTASTVSRESSPKNSRPKTTNSLQDDSTPTTTSMDTAGASSSTSSLAQPVRLLVDSQPHRRSSGSLTPPPDVAFFAESSEV